MHRGNRDTSASPDSDDAAKEDMHSGGKGIPTQRSHISAMLREQGSIEIPKQFGTAHKMHNIQKKSYICEEAIKNNTVMTQMILNIENPDIIPSLRKVLGQLKGVSVAKMSRKKTEKSEKELILQDIKDAYIEVLEADKTGRELPSVDNLFKELGGR